MLQNTRMPRVSSIWAREMALCSLARLSTRRTRSCIVMKFSLWKMSSERRAARTDGRLNSATTRMMLERSKISSAMSLMRCGASTTTTS